jgi:hypothetical protein
MRKAEVSAGYSQIPIVSDAAGSPAQQPEAFNLSKVGVTRHQVQFVLKSNCGDPKIIFRNGTAALSQSILDSAVCLGGLGSYGENGIRPDKLSDLEEIALSACVDLIAP